MRDLFQDIKDFHEKFDLSAMDKPSLLPVDLMDFRLKFLQEELIETANAYVNNDLHETADGLVDLVYVALGTAYMMGLPFNKLWAEVHNANMNKVRAVKSTQSKRGSTFDVVKPEGWKQPNFSKWLGDKL